MKRTVRLSMLSTALVSTAAAQAAALPSDYNAYYDQAAVSQAAAPRTVPALAANATATSTDALRGVPTFLWAPPGVQAPARAARTPETVARAYLDRYAPLYRLSQASLETAVVRQIHDTGRGGILVTFGQQIHGVDVFHDELKVMMRRDLSLVAISGALHPSAVRALRRGAQFKVSAPSALASAVGDLYGVAFGPSALVDRKQSKAGYDYFDLAATPAVKSAKLAFRAPARIKQVFFPLPDRLVPAYFLELQSSAGGSAASNAYAYVIAADDGRVLYRQDLTYHAFNYKVWADTSGWKIPLDGPQADFTPHPTGVVDGSNPAYIAPALVTMDGFNTNTNGTFDPWLPASATQSTGNNVDAYADIASPDGFTAGDVRATVTSPGTFDRTYDTASAPNGSTNQVMAAVTQLFYVNNWLHDWYYDSGFDEAAGNAQQDNFGRGGLGGDPLHAEAQDNSGTNNANMQAMGDGTSPIMQMYVWNGLAATSLVVQPLNANMTSAAAGFGTQVYNVTAPLALVNDGSGTVTDACQPIGGNQVAGRIALADRGNCTFVQKAQRAQNAGAVGLIIANDVPGSGPPPLGGTGGGVNIPVQGVSLENGNVLKAALMSGAQTATMTSGPAVMRDGTIDNTIVAHEWGHYIHLRLAACGVAQCDAMSEGWGDFVALQMLLRAGDDRHAAYPLAVYANASYNDSYFGIRRIPYSVDLDYNALTFKHIQDGELLPTTHPVNDFYPVNSEVHNAGEIWTAMMWEAYIGLIERSAGGTPVHTFEGAKRLMTDYVVAGLKMTPADATFTEQRDAVLAAAAANDVGDFVAMAEAFARRGAGTCAVSPPRDSVDFIGVVESFLTQPNVAFVSASLDDSLMACDFDGALDANETGHVVIELMNRGAAPLADAQATVSTTAAGVSFPNGTLATFGTIAPFATGTATVDVALDGSVTQMQNVTLNLAITSPSSCTPTVAAATLERVHFDEIPASSASDDVESDTPLWTPAGTKDDVWARELVGADHVWHGIDYPSISDTSLQSPPLQVAAGQPFILSFTHRYSFEFSQGKNWDGGVIEVSTNGGATWTDISTYGNPGYGGTINATASNPLGGRNGYVHDSAGYPATSTVTVNMGAALAGQTVNVRFRLGSDEAFGAFGWEIDDIVFQGITNTPFAAIVDDTGPCNSGSGGAGGGGVGGGGVGGAGVGGAGVGGAGGAGGGGAGGAGGGGTGGSGMGGSGASDVGGSGMGGSGGDASSGGAGGSGDDGGCGCTVVGGSSDTTPAPFAPLSAALALLLGRIRRRRTRAR